MKIMTFCQNKYDILSETACHIVTFLGHVIVYDILAAPLHF
jgi:hypothetical protein